MKNIIILFLLILPVFAFGQLTKINVHAVAEDAGLIHNRYVITVYPAHFRNDVARWIRNEETTVNTLTDGDSAPSKFLLVSTLCECPLIFLLERKLEIVIEQE